MTDTSTLVTAAPLVTVLQPYLTALVTALVPILMGLALNAFQKWTGIKVDAGFRDQIEKAAANEAGKAVAAAGDNLAKEQITVKSGVAVDAAVKIMNSPHLQEAINATGATPDRVASLVVGEIGKLQASMPPPPPVKSVVVGIGGGGGAGSNYSDWISGGQGV